jgi:hypothetical protein
MRVEVELTFEQLIMIVKKLPKPQWQKLKTEVDGSNILESGSDDLETFLLNGPTFTNKQLKAIECAYNQRLTTF